MLSGASPSTRTAGATRGSCSTSGSGSTGRCSSSRTALSTGSSEKRSRCSSSRTGGATCGRCCNGGCWRRRGRRGGGADWAGRDIRGGGGFMPATVASGYPPTRQLYGLVVNLSASKPNAGQDRPRQHFLYFLPLPQGHCSFLPIFFLSALASSTLLRRSCAAFAFSFGILSVGMSPK